MAVWQYSFELFSKKWFKDISLNKIVASLEDIFWNTYKKNDNSIYIWDDQVDDCLISIYGWQIDSINCRLDLRVITQEKISKLKNIATKYELRFLVIEERTFTKDEFIWEITKSSAAKFVEHPKNFIKEISKI